VSRVDRIILNIFNVLAWFGNLSNLWLAVAIIFLLLIGLYFTAEAHAVRLPEVVGWNASEEDLDLFVAQSVIVFEPGQLVEMYNVGAYASRPACILTIRDREYNLLLSITPRDVEGCERFRIPSR
jgi:hypothetical protein